jgi:hypothetical protein
MGFHPPPGGFDEFLVRAAAAPFLRNLLSSPASCTMRPIWLTFVAGMTTLHRMN